MCYCVLPISSYKTTFSVFPIESENQKLRRVSIINFNRNFPLNFIRSTLDAYSDLVSVCSVFTVK